MHLGLLFLNVWLPNPGPRVTSGDVPGLQPGNESVAASEYGGNVLQENETAMKFELKSDEIKVKAASSWPLAVIEYRPSQNRNS